MSDENINNLSKIDENHFEVAYTAGARAVEVSRKRDYRVDPNEDGDVVISMREISEGKTSIEKMEKFINSNKS